MIAALMGDRFATETRLNTAVVHLASMSTRSEMRPMDGHPLDAILTLLLLEHSPAVNIHLVT